MKIGGDKYSYRDKWDPLKAYGRQRRDCKEILSGHAAYIIVWRRSTAVSKTNTILLCNTILFLRL